MNSLAHENRSSANLGLQKQLPIWPESVRGGPNAILRSALFAGIQSKKRQIIGRQTRPDKNLESVPIASQDGITINFAGMQLNQYDADVFFETLHRARRQPMETVCQFQGADFLKSIGRSCNNLSYEDLEESLQRLRRGSVDLEWKVNDRHYRFSGSLIAYFVREQTTKTYKVTFAKEILTLFAPASWTQLEWDQRQAIKGKPLAQWLHSYYSTHAAPFPVTVAFLHNKSGSPTTLLKHFKTELNNAFATLSTTLGWSVTWNRNLVTVTRNPSAAQNRHVAKKIAKTKRLRELRETQGKQRDQQLALRQPAREAAKQETFDMFSTRQVLDQLLKAR
ncbi:plasmid replication initiator TrfA [Granulicella arctica]|uniref:plasmid replication initiator TrfA n=1 Tax=Granulicella arctica TaxID=940613 RepID=UPI0021DFE9A4|nr:plasmid replication initiator TrfA [Granulicella arctica]